MKGKSRSNRSKMGGQLRVGQSRGRQHESQRVGLGMLGWVDLTSIYITDQHELKDLYRSYSAQIEIEIEIEIEI